MSFGRSKHMSRRPFRPDGRFHRDRRRREKASRMTLENDGILKSLWHLLKTAFRKPR